MAIEIVDFPIKNGGSFHGKMLVHQRVGPRGFSMVPRVGKTSEAPWTGSTRRVSGPAETARCVDVHCRNTTKIRENHILEFTESGRGGQYGQTFRNFTKIPSGKLT